VSKQPVGGCHLHALTNATAPAQHAAWTSNACFSGQVERISVLHVNRMLGPIQLAVGSKQVDGLIRERQLSRRAA